MRTVLSAFTDRGAAEAAVSRLEEARITNGAIEVHVRQEGEDPSLGHPIDELVTGGALTNFSRLLDHLFGTANASHVDAKTLASEVKDGGAVVIVDALDDHEAEQVQAFLLEAGAARQAHMPKDGDLD